MININGIRSSGLMARRLPPYKRRLDERPFVEPDDHLTLGVAINMYKLSALDAGFLYTETERSPQHIATVQILELPMGKTATEFVANLRTLLLKRLHLVPYFTNRLAPTPFGLDHPVWVRDSSFSIDHHLHTIEVPAPGGQLELESTVARLHETRLDRSRPLWGLWVLTGLKGGRIAYYNRVHHACLDGVAAQQMLEAILDTGPVPREVSPPPAPDVTRAPTGAELLIAAMENFLKFQAKQPAAALTAWDTAARLTQRALDPGKGLGAAAEVAPVTRFNRSVTARRVYAAGELPIADMKGIARAARATLNDVFLAVCSDGIRRYLNRTGELPDQSLLAGCPVSLRRTGNRDSNNQVSLMTVSLATDEADAVRRLKKISRSAHSAKGLTLDLAASYDPELAIPGLPSLMQTLAAVADAAGLADFPALRVPFNLVISNVPGPRQWLYSNGARVLTHYPVSIPAHGQAVNITVQSYADRMYFAITGCARALPDAAVLRDDVLAAFEHLRTAFRPEESHEPEGLAEAAGSQARFQPAPRTLPRSVDRSTDPIQEIVIKAA